MYPAVTEVLAERISTHMNTYGFTHCTVEDVQNVANGTLLDDSELERAIVDEIRELGLG